MTYSSKEAFDAAMSTGLISKRRAEVLRDLAINGPATARMIFERTGMFPGSVTPRLAELESQGMVVRRGVTDGGPTHTPAQEWAFVPGPPRPLKREAQKLPARDRLDMYERALKQIASTTCNCGGQALLFPTHLPGCNADHPHVLLAKAILTQAKAI